MGASKGVEWKVKRGGKEKKRPTQTGGHTIAAERERERERQRTSARFFSPRLSDTPDLRRRRPLGWRLSLPRRPSSAGSAARRSFSSIPRLRTTFEGPATDALSRALALAEPCVSARRKMDRAKRNITSILSSTEVRRFCSLEMLIFVKNYFPTQSKFIEKVGEIDSEERLSAIAPRCL